VRRLRSRDRLIALLYGWFAGVQSLRGIVDGLRSHEAHLYRLGARPVRRWTLGAAGCRLVTRFKSNTPVKESVGRAVAEDSAVLSDRIGQAAQTTVESPLDFARLVRTKPHAQKAYRPPHRVQYPTPECSRQTAIQWTLA